MIAAIVIVLMALIACASYEVCLGSLSRSRKPEEESAGESSGATARD